MGILTASNNSMNFIIAYYLLHRVAVFYKEYVFLISF